MRQPIRQTRRNKPEFGEPLFESLEVGEAVKDNGRIGVVRQKTRWDAEQELGYERADDAEVDLECTKPSREIGQRGNQDRVNARHSSAISHQRR